ncbi:hypothetical protein, partial [Streptosporangium sp. NPDC003464]
DQVAQLGRIVEDAARGGRPVVVAGDLNLEPAGAASETENVRRVPFLHLIAGADEIAPYVIG